MQNEYLFKGTHLCVLRCGTYELLITEVHRGSLVGHYRENKTLALLREHYFWLRIEMGVTPKLKKPTLNPPHPYRVWV